MTSFHWNNKSCEISEFKKNLHLWFWYCHFWYRRIRTPVPQWLSVRPRFRDDNGRILEQACVVSYYSIGDKSEVESYEN